MRSGIAFLGCVVLPLAVAALVFFHDNETWSGEEPNGEPLGHGMLAHCSTLRTERLAQREAARAAEAEARARGVSSTGSSSVRGTSLGGGGWSGGK